MRESKFKSYTDLPLTLNALDVAEVLGISRAAAYELVRSKGFPHMNIGKRILIPKDAFLEWTFIRAECIAYEDFVQYNGEAGAKEAGKWRLEGKTYIVQDGDVLHFRFNV
mgnify:CR=1 FL=1